MTLRLAGLLVVTVASDAPAGPPIHASSPTQTLLPPTGVGNAYGLIVALSADGKTFATFDDAAIYVFTRASSSGATTDFSVGLSHAGDGTLDVTDCGAHIYIYAP